MYKSIILALGACIALSASANAADAATRTSCIEAAGHVKDALEANEQSPAYAEANRDRRAGFDFCNAGMFQKGMDRYSHALKLLDPTAAAATTAPAKS